MCQKIQQTSSNIAREFIFGQTAVIDCQNKQKFIPVWIITNFQIKLQWNNKNKHDWSLTEVVY